MGSTGPPLLLSSGRSFGGKCSEYVLHFGSLINQQLFPAVEHMHKRAEEGGSQDEFYVLAPSYLESTVAFHFVIRDVFLREISKNSPAPGIEGEGSLSLRGRPLSLQTSFLKNKNVGSAGQIE